MGRGKLTMELIEKEKARMITYQKRKRGLKKKASEFATLCGVPTCMIIYGPRLNNRPTDVDVWPNAHKDFMQVVNLYRDKAFSSVRAVKSQNLFDFFADRKKKVDEKIAQTRRANYESKFSREFDEEFNSFSIDQLKQILAVLDNNIEVATMKLTMIKGHQNYSIENSKPPELFLSPGYNNAAQILFPENTATDFFNKQQNIPLPLPPYHHHHCQPLQLVPYDLNPMDNLMVMMNGGDQMGNVPLPLQHAARYFDPMAAMIDNRMMMNNPMAGVRLQSYDEQFPVLPNISSQVHGSRFNEFYHEMNQFLHKRER
ncbi:putative MADS-box transcription factor family protein [Melia azedarach]|uniref:MADS-box transcription factor family protein n=1 Tax=Melia azedarach TaxID=155640 RepID=A0ACC1XVF7_MELAZ|nr:putative MADS-box transcription factor family protein [Melia azedarach]